MKEPKNGEIWMADAIPFEEIWGSKSRPVVIKKREKAGFACFRCTTKGDRGWHGRYYITNYEDTGLIEETYIDCNLIWVSRDKLLYKIGELSQDDRLEFGQL